MFHVAEERRDILAEFTGERVIPGLVEDDLWNEHIARYLFASTLAHGKRVLDVGCGVGYGTQTLSRHAQYAVGFDISEEAIGYAHQHYGKDAQFLLGNASEFPVFDGSFDLITAFEVIEHLSEWSTLLEEAARVLTDDGMFLVSTPNKSYYVETRRDQGPNPFHAHEFEYDEFQAALSAVFPHVRVLTQNQTQAISFGGSERGERTEAAFGEATEAASKAHFYLAVCSRKPIAPMEFVYVPKSGNLLREREKHIDLLQAEVAEMQAQRKKHVALLEAQVAEVRADRDLLLERLHEAEAETLNRAEWARGLDKRIEELIDQNVLLRRSRWLGLGRRLGLGPNLPDSTLMKRLLSRLEQVGVVLLAPAILPLTALALAAGDLLFLLMGRKKVEGGHVAPNNRSASIVIPNWNGRDLLAKYLPSVVAAAKWHPGTEIIVVDNASEDGSEALLSEYFPSVRVLAQQTNLGFGGGSNAGFRAARNDIVVLLNNDMRVDENFLGPLLAPFADPDVFAVACQIFFSDRDKRREETGLTQATWAHGRLMVQHQLDDQIRTAFPCFYPGGGSSAFDRRKFLELGGFDEVLRPFYYEDTDLGYMAWKRGWKVLYEPRSIVFHEHRGTIGRRFSAAYISGVLKKNVLLMTWKNVHDWSMLTSHLWSCFLSASGGLVGTSDANRFTFAGIYRAFLQLPELLGTRWRAKALAAVTDREALRRPLGGYYRDRFEAQCEAIAERLNILFVSPYPIEPPVHGGAVFMKQTLEELAPLANIHLVGLLESDAELEAQEALRPLCASMHFQVRRPLFKKNPASLIPHGVREFNDADLEWAVHRTLLTKRIDVLQLEYTVLGQYAGEFRHIPCMLFEHDVFFQTVRRQMKSVKGGVKRREQFLEYLRLLRYEPRMLRQLDRVQMCSDTNRDYLLEFAPDLAPKLDSDLRAGIRVSQYKFHEEQRRPDTLLFVGSFRHMPNQEALDWFAGEVLPLIVNKRPGVKLVVVGSDPPPRLEYLKGNPNIELTGYVADIHGPLRTCAVFICPILSGSGIRVKLLEAFAAGIPSVSTKVGAEGLASESGIVCELGDTASEFSEGVLRLLEDPSYARALARAARRHVEQTRDVEKMTRKLERVYRREVAQRRGWVTAKPDAE